MAETLRTCAKTGCRWPAAASLSYRYATKQVWLTDLSAAPDPALYDLCPHHADALTVPRGWERVDDRSEPLVVVEPSARDRADLDAGWGREQAAEVVAGRGPVNRYAALAADLPRLAAEVAAAPAGAPARMGSRRPRRPARAPQTRPPEARWPWRCLCPSAPRRRVAPAAGSEAPAGAVPLHGADPLPSRELAPALASRPWAPPPDGPPIPGQLAIPVDDLCAGAGARRRRRRVDRPGRLAPAAAPRLSDGVSTLERCTCDFLCAASGGVGGRAGRDSAMTLPRELVRAVRRLDEHQLRRLLILVRGLLIGSEGPVTELADVPGIPAVSYRRALVRCGRRCDGCPHGPYWYAYWKDGGRSRSQYIGGQLPADVRRLVEVGPPRGGGGAGDEDVAN